MQKKLPMRGSLRVFCSIDIKKEMVPGPKLKNKTSLLFYLAFIKNTLHL